MLLGVLWLDRPQFTWPPPPAWPALLFMGVVGSGLAYIWWNAGVVRLGATRAAVFGNLTPLFTALIGVLLGQSLDAVQLIGAMLVIGGVIIATWP
jgi:drug/metabolite transporter (DMT)-like permease